MSFLRYPAYKPSGVEWLGEVPEHWEALPLRRLIREVTSGTSVNAIDEPASPGQAGVLKTSCVYTGEFRPEENKAILESELDRATCPVMAGSLVVSRMNTPDLVGAAGLVKNNDPFLFLPDRLWLVSFQDCDPQFMNYWCKSVSYRSQVQLACSGTSSSMQNLSQDNFYSFIAPLPPTGEQSAIATFLDRETAKIDALIAEQRRLIELLQEKRQAVISHAVTKGLNPDAPMKDSGVDWLGEVPEHWEVTALKRLCRRITDGAHISPETDNGVYCFVSTRDISESGIDFEGCLRTSEESYEYLLRTGCRPEVGDVLFSKDGTIGRTLVVREQHDFVVASSLIIIRPDTKLLDADFLDFLCKSDAVQDQVESFVKGAGLPRLSIANLMRVIGIFPPLQEQRRIANVVSKISVRFTALMAEAEAAVPLLQERRSALISAAVTGQIHVRELAEAKAAEQ
jgi:type I restriction enzyme S subunit